MPVIRAKQVIYADRADYEIEKSVIILKGNPVKLVAGDERMTIIGLKPYEVRRETSMQVAAIIASLYPKYSGRIH